MPFWKTKPLSMFDIVVANAIRDGTPFSIDYNVDIAKLVNGPTFAKHCSAHPPEAKAPLRVTVI